MKVFTEYLRSLDAHGEPPDRERLVEVLDALKTLLRRELKRKGQWRCPPSYMGMPGWASWNASAEGPLEELAFECYVYVFVTRLWSLSQQLEVKETIDGLVVLNIRHFLLERQRQNDPLGYRVFEVVRASVRALLGTGELLVLAGDARVRNDTLLSFDGDAGLGRDSPERLADRVRGWNDLLLPGLVTASGREKRRVVDALVDKLRGLGTDRGGAFLFREIVGPLREDARSRWAELLEQEQGETGFEPMDEMFLGTVRLVMPDTGVEDRQSFDGLVAGVRDRLDRHDGSEVERGHLRTLWEFLCAHAADEGESWTGAGPWPGSAAKKDGHPPSRRRIAAQLGIPRNRLPALYATLSRLADEVRGVGSAALGTTGGGSPAAGRTFPDE